MSKETDTIIVLKAVAESTPSWYDDPNGPYRSRCPFCGARLDTGGENPFPHMSELPHETKCPWIIARALVALIDEAEPALGAETVGKPAIRAIVEAHTEKLATMKDNLSRWEEEKWSDSEVQECERMIKTLASILSDLNAALK